MSSSQKATLAIFGAASGTSLAVLKNALAAGHEVNVLARTPSKLSSLSSTYPYDDHFSFFEIDLLFIRG